MRCGACGDHHTKPSAFDHFVKVDPSGCHLWLGGTSRGYGVFNVDRKAVPAHRYAWQRKYVRRARPLDLDHLCRVRRCVNPDHLRSVTRRENLLADGSLSRAAIHAAKITCPKGHPYDVVRPGKHGVYRSCRTCERARDRARRPQRKAALAARSNP